MPRNDRPKQSATAATSRVSGDQTSPGPPNYAGGADLNSARPVLVRLTWPADAASAMTR